MLIFVACSKKAQVIPNKPALLPLVSGNKWIYRDSTYDTSAVVKEAYIDTAVLTSRTTTSSAYPGVTFYNMNDSNGWFGTNSYLANYTDVNSSYVLIMDTINKSPYLFFQTSPSDQLLLSSSRYRVDSSCIGALYVYGYATPIVVNNFSCTANVYLIYDCNNLVKEEVIEYVSSSVGVVRIEDYLQKHGDANPTLYLNYSQTLQKFIPHL